MLVKCPTPSRTLLEFATHGEFPSPTIPYSQQASSDCSMTDLICR